jgi:excisionase family DNA binding protein
MSENWLTRKQAADRANVSLSTLKRWIKAGELDVIEIGRNIRITPAALDDLAHRRRIRATENLPPSQRHKTAS